MKPWMRVVCALCVSAAITLLGAIVFGKRERPTQ